MYRLPSHIASACYATAPICLIWVVNHRARVQRRWTLMYAGSRFPGGVVVNAREMSTGERAFPGDNQASIIASILNRQPPARLIMEWEEREEARMWNMQPLT